ncbi:MAG: FeoA family protein [Phycisphaerales bacterium]
MNASECDVCTCALSTLPRGRVARVHMTHLPDRDAAYLRALGLRENSRVKVCQRGQPCIVEVLDVCNQSCRVGLSRVLADKVLVEQVAETR